ncbi:MAG: translation initiation factor IF-2, partial [Ruminococcus sp.]|nr:translation initiation factor IF-2 [Ruminococcus sp.]
MIKYKVKDAATDFGVPNKKITEILKTHCNVDKKTMTALAEAELDVIFDVLTKENSVENFDKYFAARNEKLDREPEPEPEKAAPKQEAKEEKPVADKPEKAGAKPAPKTEQKGETPSHQRKRKVIDTRATNVDVERYNSKYDDLASGTS